MSDFIVDFYILYNQDFYDEHGSHIYRVRQLYYTAPDEKMAEAVKISVVNALYDAGCYSIDVIKSIKPVEEEEDERAETEET